MPEQATITVRTPAGPIKLTASAPEQVLRRDVEAFLKGKKPNFSKYPLPEGTDFQRACWKACRKIPYGQTRTYQWLAEQAGSPNAARAAGQAMRRNPMPVVVPCHRVVGSGGWIGGFAGSARPTGASVDLKRWLLSVEQGS
jgi:methylated-DNA-[protein]-cysteine S-methyltransferase